MVSDGYGVGRAMSWNRIPLDDIPNFARLTDYVRHYARETPDAEACVDLGGVRLTYAALEAKVDAIAAALRGRDVKPGDIVALLSNPTSEFWATFLAIVDVGAIFLGLNPKYTVGELEKIAGRAAPRLTIVPGELGERRYDEDIQRLREVMSDQGVVVAYQVGALQKVLAEDAGSGTGAAAAAIDPDAPCALVFTSGTSGVPKGALLRQSGFVQCSRIQAHHYGAFGHRAFNPLPINHVGCLCDTASTMLVTGSCQVFTPFDTTAMAEAIGQEKIEFLGGVPTMLQLMLADPSFEKADLRSLKRILWSGAPMPPGFGRRLLSFNLPFHNFYGMTETTGSITFTDPDASFEDVVETIGRPDPRYGVRIADPETGQPAIAGDIGEIQTQSPGVLHSYLNDPHATKAAFTEDGWFKTGDLARARQDGVYVLAGRITEMFKSGGYNVYPREVEAALETMDGVAIACVVPVSDPVFHEVGVAFIVPASETPPSVEELTAAARTKLANYKIPKRFEILTDPPILPTGKINKPALAKRALALAETDA